MYAVKLVNFTSNGVAFELSLLPLFVIYVLFDCSGP